MTEGIVAPIVSNTGSTVRGSSGRAIGYAEFGDPNGKPVLLFHGFGDSRLTRYPDDELTARLGIRLITFDRPGIGTTDPMRELTILDRTDDPIDLANSLGLRDIYLLGWSGGAPFALAAAGCMAGTVKRVAIVSGFGPFERPGFKRLAPREIKRVMTILKVAPWMSNVMASESQKSLQGNAVGAMEMSRGFGSSADAAVLNMTGVRANVTAGAEEAFRQGPAGVANDMLLLFRFKWGFNPEDVHTQVDLWYGDDDQMTPPSVGRGLASILPQPRLRLVSGGHLLYLRSWEEILRTLVADEAPATTSRFEAITPVAPASPVTEALAAASLGGTTPGWAPDDAEPAPEPVAAEGDVLGSTPAWSWMQPAQQPEPAVETTHPEEVVEREPVAQAPVTPTDVRAFTPAPRPMPSGADERARLRALGFAVDEPEPVAEMSREEAVEPAAAAVEEPTPAPRAEAALEPGVQAEVALEPAPKPAALKWEPVRVPGLIIGRPRRVATVQVVPTAPEPTPAAEAAEVAAVAEETAAADVVDVAAEAPREGAAEPESVSQPEPVAAEPAIVTEPDAEAEQEAAPPPELPEARRARLADAALERLRAAGFAFAEPEPELAPVATAAEAVAEPSELESVEMPPADEAPPPEAEREVEAALIGRPSIAPQQSQPAEQAEDRLLQAGFGAQPEKAQPSRAIAEEAPLTQTAAATGADVESYEPVVETGVGWVEDVPATVDAAAPATPLEAAPDHATESEPGPEPLLLEVPDEPEAPAAARDETLERLRAAGFVVGEPESPSGRR